MKQPPESYAHLLKFTLARLGPNRSSVLIGIDGRAGAGKTSTASWLAWQIGAPVIHLDLFVVQTSVQITWRSEDLARCLESRDWGPVIVEGVLLKDALALIGRRPELLFFIENATTARNSGRPRTESETRDVRLFSLNNQVDDYLVRNRLPESADYVAQWAEPLS